MACSERPAKGVLRTPDENASAVRTGARRMSCRSLGRNDPASKALSRAAVSLQYRGVIGEDGHQVGDEAIVELDLFSTGFEASGAFAIVNGVQSVSVAVFISRFPLKKTDRTLVIRLCRFRFG